MGLEQAGCKCVFSSESDKFAQETYAANFNEVPEGDITKIESQSIPDHDILVAGFPCQPFSISGVVKKNSLNRPHGFCDPAQGTMFFEIYRILKEKRPQALLLENVRYLLRHDGGRTFQTILRSLTEDLGYTVFHRIVDGRSVVPQHRERIYIVGFDRPAWFSFPQLEDKRPRLRDILEHEVEKKYVLSDHLWQYLQQYAAKHRARGNGFRYGLANLDGITRTLTARYYKDGSEILIPQVNGNPRRLTPRECARLMGFPDSFQISVSDTQAYRQFGNAVVVPVVEVIAKAVVLTLAKYNNPDGHKN